ncbi:hypothetical protein Xen7305DRAFT_00033660 [Xenococcus sp. PCC 7305]|uniref:hypothetical protein n=1 Tax=Xenococcus sp. PCC 7305 TaxID=102125 RepID=UPI0002ABD80F|nr:hypothetical protein [Xenococcus sp. PCC 7305]ELS03642.1 hypothetical protein Xen7305DRAFT_00033660 [Xenococcus sp. PCC 7305]
MLSKFRNLYPQGSILSELIDIDRGIYIVRVSIQIEDIILATGLAGADSVEKAEDHARIRALQTLTLEDGHLSLNLATRADQGIKTFSPTTSSPTASALIAAAPPEKSSSNNHHDSEAPEQLSDRKGTNTSTTVSPQPEIVTAPEIATNRVSPPSIASSPVPKALSHEPVMETKNIPEPEPEPILYAPEPEPAVSYAPELKGNSLEPPLELVPTEEAYAPEPSTMPEPPAEFDFNQIRHKIDLEMKRLSWTKEQGRDYLLSTYGKRSRLHLTDDELLEFWHYLETLPN